MAKLPMPRGECAVTFGQKTVRLKFNSRARAEVERRLSTGGTQAGILSAVSQYSETVLRTLIVAGAGPMRRANGSIIADDDVLDMFDADPSAILPAYKAICEALQSALRLGEIAKGNDESSSGGA